MNNKAVKANSKAGASVASGHALGPEKPKLLDPIGGKHRQGKKVRAGNTVGDPKVVTY